MLSVCDQNFNRIGVIGQFSYLLWRKQYGPFAEAELHVDVTEKNIALLKQGNIIFRQDDNEAMEIYLRKFDDSSGVDQLVVKCVSLFQWTKQRFLWGQFDFNDTPEGIIRNAINNTMVNPSDNGRKVHQVKLAPLKNFGTPIQQQISYKEVYELAENLCTTHDIGARCLFNGRELFYDFYEGVDRTINQMVNPRIILSKSRNNVLTRTYEEDSSSFKNTILIAGAGEGAARKTAIIGAENTGLARRELFVDAREISDTRDSGGSQEAIPDAEYCQLLLAKGEEKKAEYVKFIGFDCELDVTRENTKFNEDFFLGDLVTIKDDELGVLMNSRIMQADEIFQKDGKSIYVTVGKSIPTLPEKLKRLVK